MSINFKVKASQHFKTAQRQKGTSTNRVLLECKPQAMLVLEKFTGMCFSAMFDILWRTFPALF